MSNSWINIMVGLPDSLCSSVLFFKIMTKTKLEMMKYSHLLRYKKKSVFVGVFFWSELAMSSNVLLAGTKVDLETHFL